LTIYRDLKLLKEQIDLIDEIELEHKMEVLSKKFKEKLLVLEWFINTSRTTKATDKISKYTKIMI